MLLVTLLTLQPLAAPTLDEVLHLPPAVAGDLVLRGQAHGRIVSVQEVHETLQPPELTTLHLVEDSLASKGGCSRKRWQASFRRGVNAGSVSAALANVYSMTELKLSASANCGANGYVHLNPSMDVESGLAALVTLDKIRAGTATWRFACTDKTTSGLCKDDATIRRELTMLSPWSVTRRDSYVELWLGTRGQIVTTVRFRPEQPNAVEIERRIPAPF